MTPDEVFADARSAVERGDWEGLFRRLDRPDTLRIAANGVRAFLTGDGGLAPELVALCAEHGVPEQVTTAAAEAVAAMADSARPGEWAPGAPPPASYDPELHRRNVKAAEAAVTALPKAAADLPAFAGALERLMRERVGGGSVSSSLFTGETLGDLVVDGDRATARRLRAVGAPDPIAFARRRDGWRIRLFVRG